MKFNEERWRILAENKPDELHSYIPQSSISELFDEIERLEHEIAKCMEANKDAQSRLDDYRQDYAKVVNDLCPTDERHCGCVPILRRENRLISEELADAKDELKHRRDALIDAQRIYNKANEQKVHYLSALQFIASFVNAKDKTTVDDLIAIASKEIDAEGDQIVDACNYWVSKLRDAEDKLQDAQLKPKTVYTVTMYRYGNREWVDTDKIDALQARIAELEAVIQGMFPLWIAAMSYAEHGRSADLDRIRNYYNGRDNPLTNEQLHILFSMKEGGK